MHTIESVFADAWETSCSEIAYGTQATEEMKSVTDEKIYKYNLIAMVYFNNQLLKIRVQEPSTISNSLTTNASTSETTE